MYKFISAVGVDSTGSIITLGNELNRYFPDGSLDLAFKNNILLDLSELQINFFGADLLVTKEGPIFVAVGDKLTKLTATGETDAGFIFSMPAEFDGYSEKSLSDAGNGQVYLFTKTQIPNGSIYTGLYTPSLIRINANGLLDSVMGNTGILRLNLSAHFNDRISGIGTSVTTGPLNTIYLTGYTTRFTGSGVTDFEFGNFLAKLDANGILDLDFGTQGIKLLPVVKSDYLGSKVLVCPDDSLIFVRGDGAVTKLSAAGEVDVNFGSEGIAQFSSTGSFGQIDAFLDADGSILVVGNLATLLSGVWKQEIAIVKYTPSGILDTGFDSDGMLILTSANGLVGTSVFMDDQSRLVVAGIECGFLENRIGDNAAYFSLGFAKRIQQDGALDESFMLGTNGTDHLVGSNIGDIVNAMEGDDIVLSGAGDDLVIGGAGNDEIDGGEGNDELYAGDGNDTVDAGEGDDLIVGGDGRGNDHYIGGAGNDTVKYTSAKASITVNLLKDSATSSRDKAGIGTDTLSQIENIIAGDYADTLTGNAADNLLDGGKGADRMTGGLGNDTYSVDNPLDVLKELPTGGTDTIRTVLSYALQANFENLTLQGTANLKGTGNTVANVLHGNAGNNLLNGLAGNDVIQGGEGNDTLIGGAGSDFLVGGAGSDVFRFDAALHGTGNVDAISDFICGADRIALENSIFRALKKTGALSSQNFQLGSSAADKDDFIIFNPTTGELFYDADGVGRGTQVKFADAVIVGVQQALSFADFVIT
jgi:uncharacterized delta-60 repeat protein